MAHPGRKIRVEGEPGNPLGAPRLRLNRAFLSALADDFEIHGKDTIERVRIQSPSAYLRIITQIVPMQIYLGEDENSDGHRNLLERVKHHLTPEGQRLAELKMISHDKPAKGG